MMKMSSYFLGPFLGTLIDATKNPGVMRQAPHEYAGDCYAFSECKRTIR